MRFLHTSDLHLGRQFNGLSLEEDHQVILDQIAQTLVSEEVDLLILAGDIFDRPIPPASSVAQFNRFLKRIATRSNVAVAIISGNHDSGTRINTMSLFADTKRALVRGGVQATEPPLILHDAYGAIAVSALPFSYEFAAQECFEDRNIGSPQDVLIAQISAARDALPDGARWIILAHAFVAGGKSSDGERSLTRMGGIESVSPTVFEGAHYVALGHLHRPQQAGASHIRYSGSPLAFGFDEIGAEKSMVLGEIGADGTVDIALIPYVPLRHVRVLHGAMADILKEPSSNDILRIELCDTAPVIDPMKRLREIFPNACEIIQTAYANLNTSFVQNKPARMDLSPEAVVNAFLESVGRGGLSPEMTTILSDTLQHLQEEEAKS